MKYKKNTSDGERERERNLWDSEASSKLKMTEKEDIASSFT